MGGQESKLEQHPKQDPEFKESVINESAPSTPILTPLDPRSPSVNIARTPLELILGPNLNKSEEEENDDTKDVVNVVLGIDPRSPTVEFNRTPIVVETKAKLTKLHNRNLDNVRKSEIQTTPVGTTRKSTNIVPPKLLATSPVTVVPNYNNKRKSFVGLLETNIDYTETNLDNVCQTKDATFNKSLPLEIADSLPCNQLEDQMKALQMDPSISTLIAEECKQSQDMKTDQLTSFNKTSEEKVVNITAQVKDFDKKLTNLIYQDDSDDDYKSSLRSVKVKENNRTPLSIRNLNEDSRKSQSRLKVSDKPRKSEPSKIPVFKDYQPKKLGIQCENTPPNKMETNKCRTKVSRWDADQTLII